MREVTATWVWGNQNIPTLDSYCYLRVEFSSNGLWDKHIKSSVTRNKQELRALYWVLHNYLLDLRSRKNIFMSLLLVM